MFESRHHSVHQDRLPVGQMRDDFHQVESVLTQFVRVPLLRDAVDQAPQGGWCELEGHRIGSRHAHTLPFFTPRNQPPLT